jgi:tryptophan synthase alpha chain
VFTAVRAIADAGAAAYVMTYWNLVLKRGVARFAADLAAGRRLGPHHP